MLGDELLFPLGRGWVGGGLVLGSARSLGGWGVWVGVAPTGPQLDTPEAKQDRPRWEGTGERIVLCLPPSYGGGGGSLPRGCRPALSSITTPRKLPNAYHHPPLHP